MPRTIGGKKVATEKELLDFANAIRKAGGANVIEALLPSEKGNSEACLIANALNFSCTVGGGLSVDRYNNQFPPLADGGWPWFMTFPDNMGVDRIREIAKQVPGARFAWGWDTGRGEYDMMSGLFSYPNARRVPALRLPVHIGNAAEAFDEGKAFQNYVRND